MQKILTICALLLTTVNAHAQTSGPKTEDEQEGKVVPTNALEKVTTSSNQTTSSQKTQQTEDTPDHTKTMSANIQHIPRNQTISGKVELIFNVVDADQMGDIVVYYSAINSPNKAKGKTKAFRSREAYLAYLPEREVVPPGFFYWAVQKMPNGSEQPIFASASDPHWVQVTDDNFLKTYERQRLDQWNGKRSRVFLSAEAVNFGKRTLLVSQPDDSEEESPVEYEEEFEDNYYFLQVGYGYSFFSVVDELRFNLGRLSGRAADVKTSSEPQEFSPAIYYGESTITWFIYNGFRFRTSLLLGVSHEGFEYGGGGELVLGREEKTNFTIGLKGVRRLGLTGKIRLGFLAIDQLPMGTSVEITDYPVGFDYGVRLLYDIGYQFAPGSLIKLQGGFQGRTSLKGGFSLGGSFDFAF